MLDLPTTGNITCTIRLLSRKMTALCKGVTLRRIALYCMSWYCVVLHYILWYHNLVLTCNDSVVMILSDLYDTGSGLSEELLQIVQKVVIMVGVGVGAEEKDVRFVHR